MPPVLVGIAVFALFAFGTRDISGSLMVALAALIFTLFPGALHASAMQKVYRKYSLGSATAIAAATVSGTACGYFSGRVIAAFATTLPPHPTAIIVTTLSGSTIGCLTAITIALSANSKEEPIKAPQHNALDVP
jgi:hypothetical protein